MSDPEGQSTRSAAVLAASWFRGRKLGLLSPFAVGTVDQALMGVLQTRHMFLRLYGLANKVVLIDEAHAYDTYTGTLLVDLIRWLAELGCSVIVLSATLPAAKRRELVAAYSCSEPALPAVCYPRATVVERGGAPQVHPVPDAPVRRVALEPVSVASGEDATGAVAERLSYELREGGCAAWICNTVDAAQHAYLALRRLQESGDPALHDADLILYHARFPLEQRLEIEREIDRKFGKAGLESGARPSRAVLIGTQVLEQALDYSVDVMVTEAAPIDLVLQRSGRLHRHTHDRPGPLEQPRMLWIEPPLEETGRPRFGNSALIYDEVVLLRSWHALRGCATVQLPGGIEALVEAVYGETPSLLPEHLHGLEEQLADKAEKRRHMHTAQAITNAIGTPTDEDPFGTDRNLPDPEEKETTDVSGYPTTRLAEQNVTLICAHQRADGAVLSPDDLNPLDLAKRPDREEEARLLCRSVRLQHKGWVKHFSEQSVPPGWRESPVLRYYRLARFIDGELTVSGQTLRLGPELGLVTSLTVLKELH